MKLEEFRDWAQEAQNERGKVADRLKGFEKSIQNTLNKLEADSRTVARHGKALASYKKNIVRNSKAISIANKELKAVAADTSKLKREVFESNTRLVNAIKKTLPKVKKAAVAEIKDRLVPLENGIKSLKAACIIASHDVDNVFRFSDTIAFLYNGKLIIKGTKEQICQTSLQEVREFLMLDNKNKI